ncbi:MAG: DUF4260 domain-containing protein [Candidatus Micrarchaeaceae archaeon]
MNKNNKKSLLFDNPINLLRVEGICLFFISLFVYYILNGNWIILLIIVIATDFSALGYLINSKAGAIFYNAFHSYPIPSIIMIFGFIFHNYVFVFIGLGIFAHIGLDRFFGFGLKYPSGFKDTNLGKIK